MSSVKNRETFGSTFGLVMTMIGVAVGLGNVWRFPYMVGQFGGAAFVAFYVLVVIVIGIPALMAEWTLGRHTRKGTVGAFARGGLPFGRQVGWFLFFVLTAAAAYYTAVVGWVLYYAAGEIARSAQFPWQSSSILPPATGFEPRSFVLQLVCTGLVILACVAVLVRGLRAGIESVSKVIVQGLFVVLLILIVRSLTLPGAAEGVRWYIFKFDFADLTPRVMLAAMGQAIFSLSLGGTFMVAYGSYLNREDDIRFNAIWTAAGDTTAGLLAGLAIFPAVFALGFEPASGPGLTFSTLPAVFDRIPGGWLFGLLFFCGLFSAAYLSVIAAFEVLVVGITDNTGLARRQAIWIMAGAVFVLSVPPTANMGIFVPWDLIFGSGMQTLGSLLAVVTVGWSLHRADALAALSAPGGGPAPLWLYRWLRYVIPGAILTVGIWWLLTDVFRAVGRRLNWRCE